MIPEDRKRTGDWLLATDEIVREDAIANCAAEKGTEDKLNL